MSTLPFYDLIKDGIYRWQIHYLPMFVSGMLQNESSGTTIYACPEIVHGAWDCIYVYVHQGIVEFIIFLLREGVQ